MLQFAAGDLSPGAGGIAVLSRQVMRTLLEMNGKRLIILSVNVLEGSGFADGDPLGDVDDPPPIRWHGGNRPRFSLAVAGASCDMRLFDHAGLARLQGLSRLWRGRYLLMIHSVEMWRAQRSDYLRSARNARALIANSNYTARRTRECCPGLPPIHVCWPGLDEPICTTGTAAAPLDGIGSHAMLIVGRLDRLQRHKGHDQLLEALPLVLRDVPDAQLVIAGGGDDGARLERKARDLGVAEHVVFTGRLDEAELHALYAQCALFVMPSDGDGFGLVFLEAMMNRLPCVGLRDSAAAEIFEDGVSGMLVDRENRVAMADSLSGLLRDVDRRKAIGQAGYERYNRHFTGRCHAERFKTLLMEQLEKH